MQRSQYCLIIHSRRKAMWMGASHKYELMIKRLGVNIKVPLVKNKLDLIFTLNILKNF